LAVLLLSWPGYCCVKRLYFSEQPEMATHGHSTRMATLERPFRGLLSYRIIFFSKREEKIKNFKGFLVLLEVWSIKLYLKMPAPKPAERF